MHKFSVEESSPHYEQASRVISWIEDGIFDALVNGYLEKCMLVVAHDEKCENPIEVWDLSLTWNGDAPVSRVGHSSAASDSHRREASIATPVPASSITKDDVRKAAQMMMRRLSCLLQGLDEVPKDHWIGMRLLYRDSITPKEYEPAGFFQSTSGDAGSIVFQSPPTFVSAGRLATGHNCLSVGVALADVPGFEPTARDQACTSTNDGGGYSFDLVRAVANDLQHSSIPSSSTAATGNSLGQLVEKSKTLLSTRVGSQVSAHSLARELRTSPTVAEAVLQQLQNLEIPLVSTVRPSLRSREVLDPEGICGPSQCDSVSCYDGDMSEASWAPRQASSASAQAFCRSSAKAPSAQDIHSNSRAGDTSCQDSLRFRPPLHPARANITPSNVPTSVPEDKNEGKARRLEEPPNASLAPSRPTRENSGKRKASQVMQPIKRASLRRK